MADYAWIETQGSKEVDGEIRMYLLTDPDGRAVGEIGVDADDIYNGRCYGDRRPSLWDRDIDALKAATIERAKAVAETAALRRERARYCDCGATTRICPVSGERWCPNCG